MKRLLILAAFVGTAVAQIPVPQLPLTGNIGAAFAGPVLNGGNLVMTADANYTMAYPDMSAFVIKVTSTVSLTATRNLISPNGFFSFIIENATMGSQSVQIIGTSGTGFSIPNGQVCTVIGDGTNYISAGCTSSGGSGVSSINGNTGSMTFTGAGVTQSGNTFTFGGATGTYFALNPTTTQNITLPTGTHTSLTQINLLNNSLTQDDAQFFSYAAGWNNGASFNGNSDWSTIKAYNMNETCATAGICDFTGVAFTHTGPGDTYGKYGYITCRGELTNANDEGCGTDAEHLDQLGWFYGPSTVAGTGLSTLSVSGGPQCFSAGNGCTQNAFNWQQFAPGGFMYDHTNPVTTVTVASETGNVNGAIKYVLSGTSVTASTAMGTIASCTSSLQGKFGITGTQVCSVNVTYGSFVSGTNIEHIGEFIEEAGSVTVTGSGSTQSVTMQAMYPFNAGEFIGQGGIGGDIFVSSTNGTNIGYFIGGSDGTNLYFGNCLKGGCGSGGNIIAPNTSTGTVNLSRVSNVVTATKSGFNLDTVIGFAPGTTITVTGAAPSDLNGTFTIATSTNDKFNPVITWNQTAANETSTTAGTISLPLPQVTIYPASIICGSHSGTLGTADLCANHMPVAIGDAMQAPPTSQWSGQGYKVYISQTSPQDYSHPTIGVLVGDQGSSNIAYAFEATNNPGNGPSGALLKATGSYFNTIVTDYDPAYNGSIIYDGGGNPVTGSSVMPFYLFQRGGSFLSILLDPTANSYTFGQSGGGSVIANSYTAGGGSSCGTGVTGCVSLTEASTAVTPTAGVDYLRASSSTHKIVASLNGGAEYPLRQILTGTLTYTAATSDAVTITGITTSSTCSFEATNATAAAATVVPWYAVTTNTVTINHVATTASGGTVAIMCTVN